MLQRATEKERLGRLGFTVVKCLPLAQGVIPALWDRAPHQAPPLGPLPLAVSLSVKQINKILKKMLKFQALSSTDGKQSRNSAPLIFKAMCRWDFSSFQPPWCTSLSLAPLHTHGSFRLVVKLVGFRFLLTLHPF